MNRLVPSLAALAVAVLAVVPAPAIVQAWPSKPITYVVPFPAGGTTDILARLISQMLSATLG